MNHVCVSKEDAEILPEYEKFDVIDYTTFFSWMVIFGDKAEIISPESIRADYRAYLMDICSKY